MTSPADSQVALAPTPLDGLRVLETGSGVAAPYAGRLLAMLGATVVKVDDGNDPALTTWVDDRPCPPPSPLYVHLNAGKRNVRSDSFDLAVAARWAGVILDDRVRRQRLGTALDPAGRPGRGSSGVLVSVTAWGYEADEPGRIDDELLVQAASGAMTLTGDPGRPPLRLPGWQAQYLAGAYAAAAAVASTGAGWRHIDVAWVQCMTTAVEASFQHHLSTGIELVPAGAHPADSFPSGAIPCRDGHAVPGTVRHRDWVGQCTLYGRPDLVDDPRFATPRARGQNQAALEEEILPWYSAHEKRAIFQRALDGGLALGTVLTAGDALEDRHLRERQFLRAAGDGRSVLPAALYRAGPPGGAGDISTSGNDDDWFAAQLDDG